MWRKVMDNSWNLEQGNAISCSVPPTGTCYPGWSEAYYSVKYFVLLFSVMVKGMVFHSQCFIPVQVY